MSWPHSNADLEAIGQAMVANSAGVFTSYHVAFGDLSLTAQAPQIVQAMRQLRDAEEFQQLVDVCGADYPERARRFEIPVIPSQSAHGWGMLPPHTPLLPRGVLGLVPQTLRDLHPTFV